MKAPRYSLAAREAERRALLWLLARAIEHVRACRARGNHIGAA